MTARRAIAFAALIVVVAAAATALSTWARRPRHRAFEPGWPAIVVTLAGDGVAEVRDGDASQARFSDPFGVAIAPDGSIYISDAGDSQRIRRLSPDGVVSTLAGGERGFTDGVGLAARFNTPSGLAVDAVGALYVADTGNNAVRRIAPDGTVSTVAGDGTAGYRDGPGAQARFNGPVGITVDAGGRVLVADAYNDRIRAIAPDGAVVTLAGGAQSGAVDGDAAGAQFNTPCGVAVDSAGTIYVADTGNGLIRAISPAGTVSTIPVAVGSQQSAVGSQQSAVASQQWAVGPTMDPLRHPTGIAVGARREIYVTDDTGRIVETSIDGTARTVAGSRPGFADGSGAHARFRRLGSLALAAPGRLIVADAGNALVRLVGAPSQVEWRPPASPRTFTRRVKGRLVVHGRVQAVVDAWDQVNGNARRRRLGLFRLGYEVLHDDGSAVAGFEARRDTIVFNRLDLAPDAPRPRINLILYHGVLGPRAAWRSEVVRRTPTEDARDAGGNEASTAPAREADTLDTAARRARGERWASLMHRTFGFDVLACPRCGGRLRLIALIEEAAVIGRILRHLGVPTEIPAPRPARAPPLSAGAPNQPGWDDDPSVFNSCS